MKQFLGGLLILLAAHAASAQNISFGPSVGFGHSWISGLNDGSFKPGFNAGGTLVYSPAPHWGLGGDIRVSFLEGIRQTPPSFTATTNLTYLRVPLKASYFFGKYGNRLHPKLFVGPSFGFLLSAKNKLAAGNSTTVTNVKEAYHTVDFGFVAGAGLNYRLKKNTWLNLDLAYSNGLVSATKQAFYSNRNVSLNAGVTFPLGTIIP